MWRPSRNGLNFIVDVLLLLLLVTAATAACIVQFIFPAGTIAAGWTLWGLGYDAWSRIAFVCFGVFVLGVLLHLILHWNWICGFVASRLTKYSGRQVKVPPDGIRTIYGVTLLITLLTLLAAILIIAEIGVNGPKGQ